MDHLHQSNLVDVCMNKVKQEKRGWASLPYSSFFFLAFLSLRKRTSSAALSAFSAFSCFSCLPSAEELLFVKLLLVGTVVLFFYCFFSFLLNYNTFFTV